MNLLRHNSLIKFDRQFPIYNFFFQGNGKPRESTALGEVLRDAESKAKARALYFHVPFCDTICNFCPFTRGKYSGREVIDQYFQSLIKEVELKAKITDLKAVPIRAIFFGGGTPSLLDPDQILQLGQIIKETFDLSQLQEFSFEIEVKSLTLERAEAMKAIGVTHPRFGLQTFSAKWREMFELTATLEQISAATELLKRLFPYQTFDILYGMSGQDEEELISDLQSAVAMGTTNIDIYPIDNIMTQVGLHTKLKSGGNLPTSAMRKFSMTLLIDQFMRHAGFMPHNGHGYVRTKPTADVVSSEYSFIYHEHVYGYHDLDLLGFGVNAISSVSGHVIANTHSKKVYNEQLANNNFPCVISQYDSKLDYSRPLMLRLAYHGVVEKGLVHWEHIHPEIVPKLAALKEDGLIEEDDRFMKLTKLGWYWYVNIMYYLMPKQDQMVLNKLVVDKLQNPGRSFVKRELLFPIVEVKATA